MKLVRLSRIIESLLMLVLTGFGTLPTAGPPDVRAQGTDTLQSITCFWSVGIAEGEVTLADQAMDTMTITLGSDHPDLLWPKTGGTREYQVMESQTGLHWYALGDDLVIPHVDTTVVVYANLGADQVSCPFVLPHVEPTATVITTPATATQVPFELVSLTCDNWAYDPGNELQAWRITIRLSEVMADNYAIRATTDRPDIVRWLPYVGASGDGTLDQRPGSISTDQATDGWVLIAAGANEGAILLEANFQATETVITVSVELNGSVKTCQVAIPASSGIFTPIPPTSTPATVVTPIPTRTPTVVPPPAMRQLHTQDGTRSGSLTRIMVCFNRDAVSGDPPVNLTSSNSGLIEVPATIYIHARRECNSFNVRVGATNRAVDVTITATLGSATLEGVTTVRPQRPVVYTQAVSRSGGTSKVTVCKATPGDRETRVAMVSNQPTIFPVPESVTMPLGRTCLSLIIPVGTVTEDVTVTITATFDTKVASGSTIVRDLSPQASRSAFALVAPALASNITTREDHRAT